MCGLIATSVLLLMLLHSSMNNQAELKVSLSFKHNEYLSRNATIENNITQKNCSHENLSMRRLEVRELSTLQLDALVNTFENVLIPTQDITNDSLSASLNCGVAAYLDVLLQRSNSTDFLMPYWDYRLELNMSKPEESSIHKMIHKIKASNFSTITQGLVESLLSQTRKAQVQRFNYTIDEAYRLLEAETINSTWDEHGQRLSELIQLSPIFNSSIHDGGFLQLLLLVTIDIGIGNLAEKALNLQDCRQEENGLKWNETEQNCAQERVDDSNIEEKLKAFLQTSTMSVELNSSTDRHEIAKSQTPGPSTNYLKTSSLIPEQSNEACGTPGYDSSSFIRASISPKTKFPADHKRDRKRNRKVKKHRHQATNLTVIMPTKSKETESEQSTFKNSTAESKMRESYKSHTKKVQKDRKHRKKDKKIISTTPTSSLSLAASLKTTVSKYSLTRPTDINQFIEDSPIDKKNNLDLLLPYLLMPKPPKGTILWSSKSTQFPLVYFTITIINGPLAKSRRPPSYNKKRSHDARIYLMGLNMPTGYTQITEGIQIKGSNAAMVRTVNPQTTGPFVEFKIRVENKYGTSCKQMCLEPTSQRYKRCARRIVRLSTYPKFSDPIQYHQTSSDAADAQWTGRGYYRKRKFDYLLFKCD